MRRDDLILAHLDLVVSIAVGVKAGLPSAFDLDDLIAEGNLGLLKAAERYDPEAHGDAPFAPYARKVIRGSIFESCRRKRYTESTRPSVDDDAGTEGRRAFDRMTSCASQETSIDCERLKQRLRAGISLLPPAERDLLSTLCRNDEPTMRQAAGRLKIKARRAERLKGKAIGRLQARFRRLPLAA